MTKVEARKRAAKRLASQQQTQTITAKENHNEVKMEATFFEEFFGPIARMAGHSLSAGAAYGTFSAVEIGISKALEWIFSFGSVHQIEMLETGEKLMFNIGFYIWLVTFIIGAIRLIIAEVKLIGK